MCFKDFFWDRVIPTSFIFVGCHHFSSQPVLKQSPSVAGTRRSSKARCEGVPHPALSLSLGSQPPLSERVSPPKPREAACLLFRPLPSASQNLWDNPLGSGVRRSRAQTFPFTSPVLSFSVIGMLMAFLEAHVPGFVGTLKLSAESKAESVAAHLDQISKCRCGRRGARDRPRCTPPPAAARLELPPAQYLRLEKNKNTSLT